MKKRIPTIGLLAFALIGAGSASAQDPVDQDIKLFRKALSAKTTARFLQLDWRLGLLMDLQLASQTPVIVP
jgi:hypothetical protein